MEIKHGRPCKEPFDKDCVKIKRLYDTTWVASYESKDGEYKVYKRAPSKQTVAYLLNEALDKYF